METSIDLGFLAANGPGRLLDMYIRILGTPFFSKNPLPVISPKFLISPKWRLFPLPICFRINVPYFPNLAEMDLKGGIIGTGQEGGGDF